MTSRGPVQPYFPRITKDMLFAVSLILVSRALASPELCVGPRENNKLDSCLYISFHLHHPAELLLREILSLASSQMPEIHPFSVPEERDLSPSTEKPLPSSPTSDRALRTFSYSADSTYCLGAFVWDLFNKHPLLP